MFRFTKKTRESETTDALKKYVYDCCQYCKFRYALDCYRFPKTVKIVGAHWCAEYKKKINGDYL